MDAAEDLVNRLRELTVGIRQAQESVQSLAAERRALISELHDSHGWSDARMAEVLGISRAAVEAIRSGR